MQMAAALADGPTASSSDPAIVAAATIGARNVVRDSTEVSPYVTVVERDAAMLQRI
jgi:hypothetical protein